jgi:sugar phosphate isomerase/epimerase
MGSRRDFLTVMAAGLGASAVRPAWVRAADRPEIKTALGGLVGLQLWSLRESLPKDLPGTLAKVRAMGFVQVEGAGLWGQPLGTFRAALDKAGLKCSSAHMGLERLQADLAGALAEVKALGATDVVCPWIPHDDKKGFTRDAALKAAESFNRVGKAAKDAGLAFGYHCHGYEMVPATEGTLFDTLAGATDASLVSFQIDTFHAYHAGADPVQLITKYGSRARSLHLKDEKKGFPREAGSAGATADADVPVGSGQIDFPAVLKAATKAGVSRYYVEDESTEPLVHIPQTVAFLEGIKL